MGTTLTAAYVGEREVAIAHVGDSRAYCLRDGELLRLTDDHSLVDELMRQGRLTPEEAVEHPQRSVITRALGPEPAVEVDTRSFRRRAGDVYLLCSDGLTTMVPEEQIAEILRRDARLRDAGEALIAAANRAGRTRQHHGRPASPRGGSTGVSATDSGASRRRDRHAEVLLPSPPTPRPTPSDRPRRDGRPPPLRRRSAVVVSRVRRAPRPATSVARASAPGCVARRWRCVAVVVLGLIAAGAYLALQSVYFIGTNSRGLVTLYQGVPYELPGDDRALQQPATSPASAPPRIPAARSAHAARPLAALRSETPRR